MATIGVCVFCATASVVALFILVQKGKLHMGKLLLWSNLSVYIGLLISATSRTDTLGQKFSGILIALAINIIMIIRLFLEKRKFKNVAFKTSQLVYITSTLVATFGCIFLVLFGE